MSEVTISRSPEGENPREADTHYVKVKGWEYDVLVDAYCRLGGDTDTLAPLSEPSLSHNNGISQLARLLVRGDISADDFEEPIPAPERQENRFAKLNVALLPSEREAVDSRVSLGQIDTNWRNRRDIYRKLRQGVILPFVTEVTQE